MTTVSITKKEYDSLVFAKGLKTDDLEKKSFKNFGFGIFKKTKNNSVSLVNRLRKSWR